MWLDATLPLRPSFNSKISTDLNFDTRLSNIYSMVCLPTLSHSIWTPPFTHFYGTGSHPILITIFICWKALLCSLWLAQEWYLFLSLVFLWREDTFGTSRLFATISSASLSILYLEIISYNAYLSFMYHWELFKKKKRCPEVQNDLCLFTMEVFEHRMEFLPYIRPVRYVQLV